MGQTDQPDPSQMPPAEPASTAQLPAPPPPPPDTTGQPPAPPRRPAKKILAIIAAVLLLAGAIVGIALAAGGGNEAGAPEPASSPTVAPPFGLTATAEVVPFGVTLSWSAPSGDAEILGYKIFRDDLVIAAVPSQTTTYVDHNVFPGKVFTYEVVARGNGVLESERVSTQVEVPVPSMSAARVTGSFNVKAKTTSQHGFTNDLGSFTMGWDFAPKCDQGACSVVWRDLTEKTLTATLKRKGASYSGSDSGKFLGRCGSVLTDGTVTVTFHVTRAKAIGSDWRASKLVGTVTNTIPAQLGCVSAGATLSITATLLAS